MKIVILSLFLVLSAATANSVVLTLDAPDTNISGLAWGGDGQLWAVDEVTDYVYSIDPASGAVLSSFYVAHPSSYFPTGLAYSEYSDLLCVGLWNNSTTGYVYKYTTSGSYEGSVDMCGG